MKRDPTLGLTYVKHIRLLVEDLNSGTLQSEQVHDFYKKNLIGPYAYVHLMIKIGKQSEVTCPNASRYLNPPIEVSNIKFLTEV